MTHSPILATLLQAGRRHEATELFREGVHLVGANGERSRRAAFEEATRVCAGDLLSNIFFMNKIHPWLDGHTPLDCAEQSEEGLALVLDMIGAIEAGVNI